MDYSQYLLTDHWLTLKNKIYDLYQGECYKCQERRGLEVHHKTYERVGRERIGDLVLLCHDCHYRTHRMKKGFRHLRPSDIMHFIWVVFINAYSIPKWPNNRRARF